MLLPPFFTFFWDTFRYLEGAICSQMLKFVNGRSSEILNIIQQKQELTLVFLLDDGKKVNVMRVICDPEVSYIIF